MGVTPTTVRATTSDVLSILGSLSRLTHTAAPALTPADKRLEARGVISRAAAIALIVQSYNIPLATVPKTGPFKDVSAKNPYAAQIATAEKIGLVTGDNDPVSGDPKGTFRPNDPLSVPELHVLQRRLKRLKLDAK